MECGSNAPAEFVKLQPPYMKWSMATVNYLVGFLNIACPNSLAKPNTLRSSLSTQNLSTTSTMAVSGGYAASLTVPGSKLKLGSSSTHTPSSSLSTLPFSVPFRCRRLKPLVYRTGSLNPRCDGAPNSLVSSEAKRSANPSSLSALELLKTSAADRYTKQSSSIVVIGLNIHTAPVEVREKFAIAESDWPRAINELCSLNHIEEAAVLSTCNRIEIYVLALSQTRGVKEVTEWMSKTSGVPIPEISQHRFLLHDKDAIQHLFEVSAGLDSLVLGEGQILAQVKQVVKTSQGATGFGKKISGLFKHAITVGKRVRSETSISTGSVSVSSAAVELVQMKLPENSYATARVLVVGAGKMGKLVIKHLVAKGCRQMVVVNRTEDKVAAICEELKDVEITYRPLSEILVCASQADVVFTCTASDAPLFSKDNVRALPSVSDQLGGQRLFVDISVPRNVEPSVSDLEATKVYNVDDLKEVVAANKEDRLRKKLEALAIINDEVKQFEAWKNSLETVPTIKKLRAYAERIRASEVDKCLSKMGDDIPKDKKKAIYDLSLGIMNKLLHGPMEHLRCDGDNRPLSEILDNMHALNRIFGLDTDTSLLEEKVRAKLEQNQKQAS